MVACSRNHFLKTGEGDTLAEPGPGNTTPPRPTHGPLVYTANWEPVVSPKGRRPAAWPKSHLVNLWGAQVHGPGDGARILQWRLVLLCPPWHNSTGGPLPLDQDSRAATRPPFATPQLAAVRGCAEGNGGMWGTIAGGANRHKFDNVSILLL